MVFRKKTYRKRPFKKSYRKKNYKKTKKANFANPKMIYKIPLKIADDVLIIPSDPTGALPRVTEEFAISLDDLNVLELTAFTELYDEFKITGFKVQYRPRGNMNTAAGPVQGFQFYSVLDGTDLVPLADSQAALQYTNCKKHYSWKGMSRYVKCTVPVLTVDVNGNPMLKVEQPRWMQLLPQTIAVGGVPTIYDNATVAHIGLKTIFENNTNTTAVTFDTYVTVYVQFRNKK